MAYQNQRRQQRNVDMEYNNNSSEKNKVKSTKSLNDKHKNKHIFLIRFGVCTQFYLLRSLTRTHSHANISRRLISFVVRFCYFHRQKNIRVRICTHRHTPGTQSGARGRGRQGEGGGGWEGEGEGEGFDSTRNGQKKKQKKTRSHATQWAATDPWALLFVCSQAATVVFHVQQKYTLLSRENIILFIKDK